MRWILFALAVLFLFDKLAFGLALILVYGFLTGQAGWFYVPATLIAGVVGGVNIHFAQVWISNARIRLAQSEIEHLAKIAERERIARDLTMCWATPFP